MSTTRKLLIIIGRLPLLFLIDSILNGTLLNFSSLSFNSTSQDTVTHPLEAASDAFNSSNIASFFVALFWFAIKSTVITFSLVLVCSPIHSLLEVYGCLIGFGMLYISYYCNDNLVRKTTLLHDTGPDHGSSPKDEQLTKLEGSFGETTIIMMTMLTQLCIVLVLDQICISPTMAKTAVIAKYARYPTDIFLFCSFTLPILFKSLAELNTTIINSSPSLSILFPLALLIAHAIFVLLGLVKIVGRELIFMKNDVRVLGIDGMLMHFMDKTNVSWLLRIFFATKVTFLIVSSEATLGAWATFSWTWTELASIFVTLSQEVLYTMCGTILSVMGLASVVSIISGIGLRLVYVIIGAHGDEEGIQPAVSGFLFVLLAMQTGITSITDNNRLMLLFQNCVLLFVANQHVVQAVAANLVLRASTEDVEMVNHVRPMLPYILFFIFPFTVVRSLWYYPFRVSWLLAISAFSLELIIKSTTTLLIYVINMLHTHTNHLRENIDDLLFYVKAMCGCLEFACGIFLLFNGAYIFLFESGGIIRLVMMVIHFYCNIYQTAVRGWSTYKLRLSAWEKVNKLQPASQEQLDENDDICPICYQEMMEAVVVKCGHVFHKGCLQKWLSIQEKCPLCHADLTDDNIQQPCSNNNDAQPVR